MAFLLLVFTLFGVNRAIPQFDQRRWDVNLNHETSYENYAGAECLLEESGVGQDDLIISLSDHTPNYSLYLMNRKGWSGYQCHYLLWSLEDLLDKGAEYLVINKNCHVWEAETISDGFTDHLIASENDIYVYDLRPYQNP